MKRIGLLILIALFAVGMSSCSIFKKCDCPKFNYLDEEVEFVEEEIAESEILEEIESEQSKEEVVIELE